jgi:16S rRNA (cytosine1402-N4)-methyltransferase
MSHPTSDQDRDGAMGSVSASAANGGGSTKSTTATQAPHIPVLLAEVLAALAPKDGEVFVDGTFGAGGYSRALLDSCDCRVYGIDRDPSAIAAGQVLAARYGARLTLLPGRFGDMEQLLAAVGVTAVDGVALDVGVSSMQLDQSARGFSFRADGPLDMRMDPTTGDSAADLVNRADEAALADIIYEYGEERLSRAIARAIVAARAEAPIETTGRLAEVVRGAVRRKQGRRDETIDPATRTFQALRIAVNDELGELDRALGAAERLLRPGGRLAVVSFHSLEDRRVKSFLATRSGSSARPSRHFPSLLPRESARGAVPSFPPASFKAVTRKPVAASDAEAKRNPRARSARLRSAVRADAPAWPGDRTEARA